MASCFALGVPSPKLHLSLLNEIFAPGPAFRDKKQPWQCHDGACAQFQRSRRDLDLGRLDLRKMVECLETSHCIAASKYEMVGFRPPPSRSDPLEVGVRSNSQVSDGPTVVVLAQVNLRISDVSFSLKYI